MPRRDKTGPEGKGPRTGRGLGPCGKAGKVGKARKVVIIKKQERN